MMRAALRASVSAAVASLGLGVAGVGGSASEAAEAAEGVVPAMSARATPIAGVDSVWVWHSRLAADLAARVAELDVGRVFLYVGDADEAGDRNLQQSVRLLHGEGVRVYALGGAPSWTFRHHVALAWAHRALRLAPFDGVHLDVEPHALHDWRRDQQRLVADYLDLLDRVTALQQPVGVDAQFAYGQIETPGGSTFADDILARADDVTVMSYRDTAFGNNSLTEIATDWLQRANNAGKPVWLAAETNAVPDCPYCTFYDEGQAQLADVLEPVDTWARPRFPTYQGFAVEDLDGWLALGP